ncbi:MAG: hypothetical protein AAF847_08715 [Bacteroidota bacterium]
MKKDHLEQYIADHRADFDRSMPPLKTWYQIEQTLDQQTGKRRKMQVWKIASIAAAVVFLLVTGGIIGSIWTTSASGDATASTVIVSEEFRETESYYQQQLDQKLQQLATYKNESPKIIADMEQSNEFLAELKTELAQVPNGTEEVVISNIIKIYQMRLQILEQVLENLEQSKIQKQEQNEKSI